MITCWRAVIEMEKFFFSKEVNELRAFEVRPVISCCNERDLTFLFRVFITHLTSPGRREAQSVRACEHRP